MAIFLIVTLAIIAATMTQAFPAFPQQNGFGSFDGFQPLSMPGFQMTAMNQAQNMQNQGQSQGQSAAVGGGSADEGQLSSAQTSNTNTSGDGTISTGGSLGQCQGSACKLDGAAQVGNQGYFQSQGAMTGQRFFGFNGQQGGGGGFPTFGDFSNNQNTGLRNQFQSQFQTGGAAVGSGSVDKGMVSSVQDTKALTNKDGSRVSSTNLGQAAGTNALLSGAVQATGQGQTAGQTAGMSSNNQNQALNGQAPDGTQLASLNQKGSNASLQTQNQGQSQGSGAATGEAGAAEGTAQNMLSSNVETNAGGTKVASNAANTATGKGLRVSGAVSASGNSQNQGQSNLAMNFMRGSGLMARPAARAQPILVGSNNY